MKTSQSIIVELPEQTMFSRQEAASILGIGLSTLDSLIPDTELPRVRLRKRVYILRCDLEHYILANRSTGGAKMNEVLTEIMEQLSQQTIKHGTCSIEIVYHDGRITHYVLSTSVRHNVQATGAKGGQA